MTNDWNKLDSDGETFDEPTFTDGPLDVVAQWRRDYEVVTIYSNGETYWVAFESGGMQRSLDKLDDRDDAFDTAEEIRQEV